MSTPDLEQARRPPPRTFGPFEILEEIGRGGMGVVYRARQPDLGREVALKTMLPGESADREDIERFMAEAKMLAKLKHPGIVPLFDWGVEGERLYFTMPFVEGIPLNELLDGHAAEGKASTTLHEMVAEVRRKKSSRAALPKPVTRKPLPVVHAVTLARKILEPLGHAHENGVIHRDLKPSNVMVTDSGEVVLMDFGLARIKGGSSRQLTVSGMVMGTPAYMSPEQARGDSREADERTDVYAVGAMLYEMLAGRPVFEFGGDWMVHLRRILEEEPKPPAVPPDLKTIVLKALEKDSQRRYPTAPAMAEDLRRFLADEPILARPPSRSYRARKWVRRHRALSAAVGVALAALAATVVVDRVLLLKGIARAVEALDAAQGRPEREKALREARRAAGDSMLPPARELRRRFYAESADLWIAEERHDLALGLLQEARVQFPDDARIAELHRVCEGIGSLSLDTVPTGAAVTLWRQEELERIVDDVLGEEDRMAADRARRIFLSLAWRRVALYDFRNGPPEGMQVREGTPVFSEGMSAGESFLVVELPAKTHGPTRLTIRGRCVAEGSWEMAAWCLGFPYNGVFETHLEGLVVAGTTPSLALRYEDSPLARADLPAGTFAPGRPFEIVLEWAAGCGRALLNGAPVVESTQGAQEAGTGTGLILRGPGVLLEDLRVETAALPEAGDELSLPAPRRPVGEAIGATPIRHRPLPMGSYVLELSAGGRTARVPVHITRNRRWEGGAVRLDHEIPDDMVLVPGGPAIIGERELTLADFAIARHEVTKVQYWEFLKGLSPKEREDCVPRVIAFGGANLHRGKEDWGYGPYDPVGHANQNQQPVTYVPFEGAQRYGAWLSERSGRTYRLPTAEEWEKAARGVDGRAFPWGARYHRRRAKLDPLGDRIVDVTTFPWGAGPYGARHLCGNVAEWTLSFYRSESWARIVKGGSYMSTPPMSQCSSEERVSISETREHVGFRVMLELPPR